MHDPSADERERSGALIRLAASGAPGFEGELAHILLDGSAAAGLRRQSAQLLARYGSDEAVTHLAAALEHRDEHPEEVRRAVVAALGWAGAPEHLALIEQATGGRPGEFAAVLLAHRHRLDGHDLASPPKPLSAQDGEPFAIVEALTPERSTAALEMARTKAPHGIAAWAPTVFGLHCGRRRYALVLSEAATGKRGVAGLAERKAIAGVLGRWFTATRQYSLAGLVLAGPERQRTGAIRIAVHRPTGEARMAGSATGEDGRLAFRLDVVARPGAIATTVAGEYEPEGGLTLTAIRDPGRRIPAREPLRLR